MEKIRKFTIIARRSIANRFAHVPGKVRISLEDEYLSPAIARRNKYASLLNLDVLSDEPYGRVNFDLRTSKSLTTLTTNDSREWNDTNNHDPIANDLSVAEKSMKMLNITAEDVMDARARIQERPYWNEQDITADTVEEVMAQFSLEKLEEKIDADRALKEEDTTGKYSTEEYRKKGDSRGSLTDSKSEILSGKRKEDILLVRNGMPKETKKEVERAVKILQCPSSEEKMEAKPCASFIRKLEAKLYSISVNQKERKIDRKKDPCQVTTKSTSASSSSHKEEFEKNSKICACHHVPRNIYTSRSGKDARSVDSNDKSVKRDTDKKESKRLVSTGIAQKGRVNEHNSTLKYSEIYRLKKQMKQSEDSLKKQSITWESVSLARTAHFSGYAKNIVATDKISVSPTKTFNESNDSLNARRKLKYIEHMRGRPSVDLRSIFKIASLKRKNYAEFEAYNDLALLESKRETKMRKYSNRKLSIEDREAIERSALRICNDLTLLENKKELEARKKRDLSSNHKQTTKISEMKVSGANNESMLLKNKKEMKAARKHNLSPSYKQSIEKSSTLKARNKLAENTRELQAGEIRDPMKYETSSKCEEDVDTPSVSNHLSGANHGEDTTSSPSETHRNANARTLLNLREITKNIEWTIHPRGITLINKNLYSQFLENGRFHESRQRDIVDDNIANTLHNAFNFKPEIMRRIFRRAQTRIGEVFPNIPTFLREDFNTEFVCCVNNEMIVRDRFSFFDIDFEWVIGNQNNLENLHNSENRVVEEAENQNLCTQSVDPEEIPESETGTANLTEITGSQEDARSSTGNIETTSILTFDENHEQVDNGTSDHFPVQSIIEELKSFCTDVSEKSICSASSIGRLEEQGNTSSAIEDNGFRTEKFIKNNTSSDEENNNERYRILERSADIEKTIDSQSEEIFDDSASSSISHNNHHFNTLISKRNEIKINCITSISPKSSSSSSLSFVESENYDRSLLNSSEERLQKLTQLSNSETTSEMRRSKSILNSEIKDDDAILELQDAEILMSKAMQNSARSEDEDRETIHEKANEFPTHRFFGMNSAVKLQQDDSLYSTYERYDSGSNTPVSVGDGSLMEEFSNDIFPPVQSTNVPVNNSRQNNS